MLYIQQSVNQLSYKTNNFKIESKLKTMKLGTYPECIYMTSRDMYNYYKRENERLRLLIIEKDAIIAKLYQEVEELKRQRKQIAEQKKTQNQAE